MNNTKQAMEAEYGDISTVLDGTTILVTGAAGFVGTALLYRLLLDPQLNTRVRRVLALIRGSTFEEAAEKLPPVLRELARPIDTDEAEPKLLILRGDCRHAKLGLTGPSLQAARQADIVIHAAGETRFMLGLPDAMDCITDLAYMAARFSLGSSSVRTHIHLSTTYVGWFMRDGSTVTENFLQTDVGDEDDTHANTYLHAKTFAEESVNALFKPQAGRPAHGKAARILRICTLGAAAAFPSPGCGACQTSTPVSAALAAVPVSDAARPSNVRDGSFLDVLPVDIAVNQILALTAAAHRNHILPPAALSHPRNPRNPINKRGTNVPVYHVASGLHPQNQLRFLTLNKPEVKIAAPYVKEKSLMDCYLPFIEKQVHFDVSRARAAMGGSQSAQHGIDCTHTQDSVSHAIPSNRDAPALLFPEVVEELSLDRSSAASHSVSPSLDGSLVFDDELPASARRNSDSGLSDLSCSLSHSPCDGTQKPYLPIAATATTFNLDRAWVDQPINCGSLETDCGKALEARFGPMTASEDSAGWVGYLEAVRDEMNRHMSLAAEDSWVD